MTHKSIVESAEFKEWKKVFNSLKSESKKTKAVNKESKSFISPPSRDNSPAFSV